jgi:hypothetical protein
LAAVVGMLLFAALVAAREIPLLRKQGLKREIVVFVALLLLGTVLNILHFLGLRIKSPLDWIYVAYKPLSDFFFHFQ